MATEKQVEFFKLVHQMERDRTTGLRETAKTYINLSSIYSAFIIFVAEKLRPVDVSAKMIFSATIVSMLLAFLFSILVVHVANYQGLTNLRRIIENFGDQPPTDDDFFDDRIVDYAVACQRNLTVNNQKARFLSASGYLILIGLALHAAFFLDWLVNAKGFGNVG